MKYVFVLWCPGYIEIKMQQSMIQECPVTTAGFEDCGCDSTGAACLAHDWVSLWSTNGTQSPPTCLSGI